MEELIVKEQEIRESLVKVINESKMPAFILEPMIKELYEQITKAKEQQYNEAKAYLEQKEKKKKEVKENGQD